MSRKYEFDEILITCSICLEIYNDNDRIPLMLTTCSHTFCKSCLTQQNHRQCALCRTALTSNNFLKNLTITELLNAKNEYERVRPIIMPPLPPPSITALLGNNEDKIRVFIVLGDNYYKWTHPFETTNPLNRQLESVKKNSIISGLVVDNHCGVFLKLESQSRYVAIRRVDEDYDICKEIPFEKVNCIYAIKNTRDITHFSLRTQPDYDQNCRYEPELSFPRGTYFISRGRTIGEHKDVFVRVKHSSSGKYGWLFITREGEDCLELIKTGDDLQELERELPRLEADSHRKRQAEEVRKRLAEEARKREEEEKARREEETRRRLAEEARMELQRQRLLKGKHCTWSLAYHDYIPDDMTDYKCVAIGESGYACVDYHGNVRFHGIPSNVQAALRNQQLKNVDYLTICCCKDDDDYTYYSRDSSDDDVDYGSKGDKYFVQKINGKQYYSNLSKSLTNTIKKNGRVEVLVLGPNDEYYVKFQNGSSYILGLDDKAQSIFRSYTIITIWIGASNSYYIKYNDGNTERVSYKNLPRGLQVYATNSNYNIREMLYDKKSESYFVRYN